MPVVASDYRTHPEFAAFLAAWEKDGCPPLPLADWLRERGHHSRADAVEWAAGQPDKPDDATRPVTWRTVKGGVRPFPCGPWHAWGISLKTRCGVPIDVHQQIELADAESEVPYRGGKTFPDAIVAFLDAWAAARPHPEDVT